MIFGVVVRFIRGLYNVAPRQQGTAVTIGNYDGLHVGHRALIERLREHAQQRGLRTALILFEPHPLEHLKADAAPKRIQRLRDKILSLREIGLDEVLCLRFNDAFANLHAEEFVSRILVHALSTKYIVVGDDFRFGHERKGSVALLRQRAKQFGFEVESHDTYKIESERVSSTRIRAALEEGDQVLVSRLLGRPYLISGRVQHGAKLGRKLGVATANISLGARPLAAQGIYAVNARLGDAPTQVLQGVASIGTRPSVSDGRYLLEVHLFDFDADIYGKQLFVELRHKLRDEEKFESLEALRKKMMFDIKMAHDFFATHGAK